MSQFIDFRNKVIFNLTNLLIFVYKAHSTVVVVVKLTLLLQSFEDFFQKCLIVFVNTQIIFFFSSKPIYIRFISIEFDFLFLKIKQILEFVFQIFALADF